jgi:hypothetical protein
VGPAAIRPSEWELPLLVHVGGAMLLVGSLVAVATLAVGARSPLGDSARLTRAAFRVLLLGVLPAWIVMRAGAQWIESKEDFGDVGWIGVGYSTSEGGLLLIIAALVVAWRATRREDAASTRPATVVMALTAVLLLAYVVTIWAMTTKPG